MTSANMYMENILDYYKNPRNFGKLKEANYKHKENNPLCGDILEFQLLIKDGKVKDVRFDGKGCAISMASASMLTEKIKDKQVDKINDMTKEDIFTMLGIDLSPVRIKCALLPLEVLHKCLIDFRSDRRENG